MDLTLCKFFFIIAGLPHMDLIHHIIKRLRHIVKFRIMVVFVYLRFHISMGNFVDRFQEYGHGAYKGAVKEIIGQRDQQCG